MNEIVLADEDATLAFGRVLAQLSEGKGFFTLSGDLGAGKTTLSRGLIQALGHNGAVKSPTYTLVEPYELPGAHVFHYDLYRLGDPGELHDLGVYDQLGGDTLTLMEWPERAGNQLPAPDLALTLTLHGQGRSIRWQALTPLGKKLSAALRARYQLGP